MAWTYDITTTLGKVRFLVGDTDTNDQLLSDAEVNFCLAENGNQYMAASLACEAIAMKVGQRLTVKGSVAIDQDQQYQHWMTQAKKLRARGSRVVPFAGGISVADKEAREADEDRVKPSFARDMQTTPGDPFGVIEPDLTRIGQ